MDSNDDFEGLLAQLLALQDEQAKAVQKAIADLQAATKQVRADVQADMQALRQERQALAKAAIDSYSRELELVAKEARGRMADDVQEIVAAARLATAQIMAGVRSLDRSHEGLAQALLRQAAFVLAGILLGFFSILWFTGRL